MTYAEALLREQTPQRAVSVLVVDDDPNHRDLIARRLKLSGARVTVSDGEDALVAAAAVDIDVVVLDYRMRGCNGLDLLRDIRARPLAPSVVMVTGMGSEEVAIDCMRAGATDYLIKDRNYLVALPTVVERAWRHHDVERRARELQRLAVLVGSAPDWDSLLNEVVRGAMTLLAADHCEVVSAATGLGANGQADSEQHELRVPVATAELGRVGDLVARRRSSAFSSDERDLASSLAAFAAIASGNLHRLELERSLVRELQQTLDVRRHIAASVSHELRTPLTAISGFAQTLLASWDRLEDATRIDMISRVRSNASELTALVEQLLDFAAVEAGRSHAERVEVDVAEAVESAVADLGPLLADRTVVVDIDPGTRAMGDPDLIRRTLYNLLTNAAKYTPIETAVAVRSCVVDHGDRVRIEVADTGAGLSEDEIARAFEAFWRGEGNRRTKRGTGIGLSLVRDYVRLMDGEVGVESTLGEGCVFWFTLRVAPANSPARAGRAGSPAPG
jgi:signal transduction histidine kinase